jgi:hypothetical protein
VNNFLTEGIPENAGSLMAGKPIAAPQASSRKSYCFAGFFFGRDVLRLPAQRRFLWQEDGGYRYISQRKCLIECDGGLWFSESPCDDDGLMTSEVGRWAETKYRLLALYD